MPSFGKVIGFNLEFYRNIWALNFYKIFWLTLTKQETDRDKTAGFKLRFTCDHFSES